jgi:hypothetical protein
MKNLRKLILMKAVRMVFLVHQSEFQTFSKKTFRKGMTLKLFYFGLGKLGHRGCSRERVRREKRRSRFSLLTLQTQNLRSLSLSKGEIPFLSLLVKLRVSFIL